MFLRARIERIGGFNWSNISLFLSHTLNYMEFSTHSKILVNVQKPNIRLLHESMGEGSKIVVELRKMLWREKFTFIDVRGNSHGLFIRWRYRVLNCTIVFDFPSSLEYVLFSQELWMDLIVFHIYGPYNEREILWEHVFTMEVLR